MKLALVLRVAIGLALTGVCLWQCQVSWAKYRLEQKVTLSTVQRTTELLFPSITVCSEHTGRLDPEDKETPLKKLIELRQMLDVNNSVIIKEGNLLTTDAIEGWYTAKLGIRYSCFTYNPPKGGLKGPLGALFMSIEPPKDLAFVIIHGHNDFVFSSDIGHGGHIFLINNNPLLKLVTAGNNRVVNVIFGIKLSRELVKLYPDESRFDCRPHVPVKMQQCLEDYVERVLGCVHPLFKKDFGLSNLTDTNHCNSSKDYFKLQEVITNLSLSNVPDLAQVTGCFYPCQRFLYRTLDVEQRFVLRSRESVQLSFSFQGTDYPVYEEVELFGFEDLVAAWGGYLGLFLGQSALGLSGQFFSFVSAVAGPLVNGLNRKG